MFAVLTAHAVPDHVQGYLSRFLTEVEAGVYVGVTSPAVIQNLWDRLQEVSKDETYVLIHSDHKSEQGFSVVFSGVSRSRLIDSDGIQLVSRREELVTQPSITDPDCHMKPASLDNLEEEHFGPVAPTNRADFVYNT